MATNSHIEWTDATWNPVTGCTKISPGCKHCYAERLANRLQAMGQANYRNGFKVTLQPQMLELPLKLDDPPVAASSTPPGALVMLELPETEMPFSST